ncbi:hypothetical protein Tco_0193929 [Tanacetum coccineum]
MVQQGLSPIVYDMLMIVKKQLVLEMLIDESLEMIVNESLDVIDDESLDIIMDESLMVEDKSLEKLVNETLKLDEEHFEFVIADCSLSLTQTGMNDFVSGHAVIEVAQHKRVKYEAKCADIGYGFLPFSFSSFGELEKDAITLLKWIKRFSVTQDIGARAAVHILIGSALLLLEEWGPR